ncbi:MAG: Glu-tRNA(Gln) amidotransferase subunit GatE [Candidatus Hodarchaeota archaeon]
MPKIDYEKVGALIGIEVHQQLDTQTKLFCNCPTEIREDEPHSTFIRRLRPTQSELGEVDPAALFEFQKERLHVYETYDDSICLVEHDEEPPHLLDGEAVDFALEIALLMNAEPVDEIQIMRKLVIDGSNTTGFQRSVVVAFGGTIKVDELTVPIQTIGIEEDAARKIREEGNKTYWRIDRLGIPLIEVATAPVMKTPEQAQATALRIGQIFRVTKKVKRGLGTIRQDINVSIKDGAIIEIKGVQKLNLIKQVVKYEVQRQVELLNIRKELKEKGIQANAIKNTLHDVTSLFQQSDSKVIKAALKRKEGVFALLLPGFAGFVGRELQPNRRLGSEFADYAQFWGNVQGIFHSDELPKYGITAEDLKRLRTHLKSKPADAIILVAAIKQDATEALEAVAQRARDVLNGVPEETRGPLEEGTTRYMRPRPGAARMYPETDVAPVAIDSERLNRIKNALPELPEKKLEQFRTQFHLSAELAQIMIRSLRIDLFEVIAQKHPELAVTLAATLETLWTNLEREGLAVDDIPEEQVILLFDRLAENRFAKEAIEDLLSWLAQHPTSTTDDGLQELGLTTISETELKEIVERVVAKNTAIIKERKERAMGPLMGLVMKEVRGRADGKLVNDLLLAAIRSQLMN